MKTNSDPLLSDGEYIIKEVHELNFFSLMGTKTVVGTSNKQYHIELQVSKIGKSTQIFSMYGATGGNLRKEWRYYNCEIDAKTEYDVILKSKLKKGYVIIDVAQRAQGSEEAKKITKAVQLKNIDGLSDPNKKKSSLHFETQRLIGDLMGATNQFVIQTLKCPLGQLTNAQIDKGRDALNETRKILVSAGAGQNGKMSVTLAKKDESLVTDLTNEFYRLIPHNLGQGARGQMTELMLNDLDKILKKEYDLDTLLDAKLIGATLVDSSVDKQYESLQTTIDFVEPSTLLFKWLNDMIHKTKANNHHALGKIILLNAWKISRHGELNNFLQSVESISSKCKTQIVPHQMESLIINRTDLDDKNKNLYKKANVIPLFHGTRTQNLTSILKNGLLIRPSNAYITGAMYGAAIYFGKSTKSINYTNIKSSYWANGNDDKAYLFISDCCLGNAKIADKSYQYNEKNITPHHSVWARGGSSGVINDEFMLYNTKQHNLKYILEFTCN